MIDAREKIYIYLLYTTRMVSYCILYTLYIFTIRLFYATNAEFVAKTHDSPWL